MTERGTQHIWQYRPGEMVVAIEVPEQQLDRHRTHAVVRDAIQTYLSGQLGGVFHSQQRRQDPIVFRARDKAPLAFLFYDLAELDKHDFVKQVIHATHAQDLAAFESLREAGMKPVGVMPHWLGSAQQGFGDGSPATRPRPTTPPNSGRWRYHYAARSRRLGRRTRGDSPVRVMVLDTNPNWERVRRQAKRFRQTNAQLDALIRFLGKPELPDNWHAREVRAREEEAIRLARSPDGRERRHDVSDHALFVAGLIHDLAPSSKIELRPVLNRFGVGDLHLLLLVLEDLLANEAQNGPLVINMSLGFVPKLEHLPWMWHGVDAPNDPDFIPDVPIPGQAHTAEWMAQHRGEVERSVQLLHTALGQLATYLIDNNCLAVAAAGNDSLKRVERGRPRFGPRVPARYESVLGVAATTQEPRSAAEYSNMGEELELGDHIATFGGGVNPQTDEPDGGVVGLYTQPNYPGGRGVQNTNGWAEWSGTSFATAIASGLVSSYWSTELADRPKLSAEDVLLEFHQVAREFAPAVRTPSIPISGDWQRA